MYKKYHLHCHIRVNPFPLVNWLPQFSLTQIGGMRKWDRTQKLSSSSSYPSFPPFMWERYSGRSVGEKVSLHFSGLLSPQLGTKWIRDVNSCFAFFVWLSRKNIGVNKWSALRGLSYFLAKLEARSHYDIICVDKKMYCLPLDAYGFTRSPPQMTFSNSLIAFPLFLSRKSSVNKPTKFRSSFVCASLQVRRGNSA